MKVDTLPFQASSPADVAASCLGGAWEVLGLHHLSAPLHSPQAPDPFVCISTFALPPRRLTPQGAVNVPGCHCRHVPGGPSSLPVLLHRGPGVDPTPRSRLHCGLAPPRSPIGL